MTPEITRAMAQPADATLDGMAKAAARRAAVVCGVADDVISVKEIYRAIISVANGYAASLSSPKANDDQ